MIEKAKLDVLEDLPDIDLADIVIPIENDQESPLHVTSGKWALNKLLVISIPAVIFILIIGSFLWSYFARTSSIAAKRSKTDTSASLASIDKKSQNIDAASSQTSIQPANDNNVNLKDFIIDLRDKTGKSKILVCDFVLEVNSTENISGLENREDIRNIIYQTATGRSAVALRSVDERNKLKKELLRELNQLLGDGFIKNVYLTNYVIM
ncbi:MAG: flagellar basal body-associated FliL family protein [Smithella sp.]